MRAEPALLELRLKHRFGNPELLHRALTHSSLASETRSGSGTEVNDNEQMEFLGDSVLGLVVSDVLFRRFPSYKEGELSTLKARLVSAAHLHGVARRLELGDYLELGRGEEMSGGRNKKTLLVDALEAIIAAIYLDGGLEVAREFVLRNVIAPELERMERGGGTLPVTDFKSALQEAVQSLGLPQPAYVMVEEAGPEHSKTFTVEARLHMKNGKDQEFVGRAQGSTKKTAEQDAARQLLTFLASRSKAGEAKAAARASQPMDK